MHAVLLALALALLVAGSPAAVVIDYVADVGDGWQATFAVAASLAQPELVVRKQFRMVCSSQGPLFVAPWCWYEEHALSSPLRLKRGTALLNGGDLCYPEPSAETWMKFELPYTLSLATFNASSALVKANEANEPMVDWLSFARFKTLWLELLSQLLMGVRHAQPSVSQLEVPATPPSGAVVDLSKLEASDAPRMFVIPGNHDLLDTLREFNLNILEQDALGGWQLPQSRPYYATRAGSVLLLGLFDMISQDIDHEQFLHFTNVLSSTNCTHVVMAIHQPFFLVNRATESVYTGRRFRRLIALMDRLQLRLVAMVFGDMHFEAAYAPLPGSRAPHILICGGGGAFAETTAHLPDQLEFDVGAAGGPMRVQLRDEPFASRSEWMHYLLPAHCLLFLHRTVFAVGLFFTAIVSLVLRSLADERKQNVLVSPDVMSRRSPLSSHQLLNFFVGSVVLVAVVTEFDLEAVLATCFAGLLLFLSSVVSRMLLRGRAGLAWLPQHLPVLAVVLTMLYTAPPDVLLHGRLQLFFLTVFLLALFFVKAVERMQQAMIVLMERKAALLARIRPSSSASDWVSVCWFYGWLLLEKQASILVYALLWSVSALVYCGCHVLIVLVMHNLDFAASSMSSLLGLTGYKSFLRFSFNATHIVVHHLGFLHLPAVTRPLSMLLNPVDGLWHVHAPDITDAVGLIRTTVIDL